jgi:hypothetical protein
VLVGEDTLHAMARFRDVTAEDEHFGLQAHAQDRSRDEDDADPRGERGSARISG